MTGRSALAFQIVNAITNTLWWMLVVWLVVLIMLDSFWAALLYATEQVGPFYSPRHRALTAEEAGMCRCWDSTDTVSGVRGPPIHSGVQHQLRNILQQVQVYPYSLSNSIARQASWLRVEREGRVYLQSHCNALNS